MERRWKRWLASLTLLQAAIPIAVGNDIALHPLPTNTPLLGDGLGRFLAGPAHWTIEWPMTADGWSMRWAGPADFDGDGRMEWAMAAATAPQGKRAKLDILVVMPDPNGRSLTPRWSHFESGPTFLPGGDVVTGDFNGDGFADLAAGMPLAYGPGQVLVFAGSHTNLSLLPVWKEKGSSVRSEFGTSLLACDVNRDGFADLVVGESGINNGAGRVWVFSGSPLGLSSKANGLWKMEGMRAGERFGERLAVLDANGDGPLDLAVSAPGFTLGSQTNAGQVRLYLGTNGIFGEAPVWQATGSEAGAGFGQSLCALGDLNKDGFDELGMGWWVPRKYGEQVTSGEVCVFYGQSNGLASEPRWRKSGPVTNAQFGASISSVGDVNGDGWRDVLIGCPGVGSVKEPFFNSRACLFLGGPQGMAAEASWTFWNPKPGTRTGRSTAVVGDINGDGLPDFAVGTPLSIRKSLAEVSGRIDIFLGRRHGYASGETFPIDGTNSSSHTQAPTTVASRREVAEQRRSVARQAVAERQEAADLRGRRLGWSLMAMSGVLAFVYGMGRWQRRRAATAAAHRERERIARDLHDGVGSELHGIQRLTELLNRLPEGSFEAERCRAQLLEAAQKLGGSMDRLISGVKPENDTLENLVTFLADYAPGMLRPHGISCELNFPAALPVVLLPGETRQHLFLAVNEALNNVVKHSGAKHAWLRITWAEPWLEIVVEDDGCGPGKASPRSGGGNGMKNLTARMEAMRGRARVTDRDGGGTRMTLRLPLRSRA